MRPNVALGAAVVCAAFAISVIAVDLRFSLVVRLDERTDGGWETRASSTGGMGDASHRFPQDCAGTDLRVALFNDKPLPDRVDLLVTYTYGPDYSVATVVRETWRLDAFEERSHEFQIPDSAFQGWGTPTSPQKPPDGGVNVNVQAGNDYLSLCVREEDA